MRKTKEFSLKSCRKIHKDVEAAFHLFPLCVRHHFISLTRPFSFFLFSFQSTISPLSLCASMRVNISRSWGGEAFASQSRRAEHTFVYVFRFFSFSTWTSTEENNFEKFPFSLQWSRAPLENSFSSSSCSGGGGHFWDSRRMLQRKRKETAKNVLCQCWLWQTGGVSAKCFASLAGMLIMINNFHRIVRCCALLSCNCFGWMFQGSSTTFNVCVSSSDRNQTWLVVNQLFVLVSFKNRRRKSRNVSSHSSHRRVAVNRPIILIFESFNEPDSTEWEVSCMFICLLLTKYFNLH